MSCSPIQPRILITGAAGRVGRVVVPLLRDRYRLRLTDLPGSTFDPPGPEGECWAADLNETGDLPGLLNEMDAVIHLAGTGRQASPWNVLFEANIKATFALVDALKTGGCRRLVYVSSVHAVGGYPAELEPLPATLPPLPATPYGLSKATGELLVRTNLEKTMTVVILRLGALVGAPLDEDVRRVRADPQDLLAAVEEALTWKGPGTKVLNVVSRDDRLKQNRE